MTAVINKLVEQFGIEIVTNMPTNSVTAYKSVTNTTIKNYETMPNKFKTHSTLHFGTTFFPK